MNSFGFHSICQEILEIPVCTLMEHRFSGCFTRKFLMTSGILKKVVLFSRWKLSGRNAYFIYEFTPEITSSRLSMAIYLCHHLEI